MSKSKTFQELNLVDGFLFGASTENPKDAEYIAKIIIERATGKKVKEVTVTQEKPLLGVDVGYHGIRMALYVSEYERDNIVKVYDIEPNRYGITELPRRSRFSQALTDAKLLKSGENYNDMPEYLSIWILTKDPFGKNQMLYCVKNYVAGFPEIVYNDGVTKLFLYVGGELGGSEALRDLLRYFGKSDKNNVVDEDIEKLHTIVEKIKHNRKVGEQYMTWQEMLDYEKEEARQEAREEGLAEGRAKGLAEGLAEGRAEGRAEGLKEGRLENIAATIKVCKKLGASDEQIILNLIKEFNFSEEEAKAYLMNCNY